ALVGQETGRVRVEPGRVRAVLPHVEECLRVLPLAPAGAHQHPRAPGDLSIVSLPRFDARGGQQEVVVALHLRRHVEDAGGTDETPGGNGVAGILVELPAGDPMDRRVEVSPGVLSQPEAIPIPGWAAIVVA